MREGEGEADETESCWAVLGSRFSSLQINLLEGNGGTKGLPLGPIEVVEESDHGKRKEAII
jgi:hypothetical protein